MIRCWHDCKTGIERLEGLRCLIDWICRGELRFHCSSPISIRKGCPTHHGLAPPVPIIWLDRFSWAFRRAIFFLQHMGLRAWVGRVVPRNAQEQGRAKRSRLPRSRDRALALVRAGARIRSIGCDDGAAVRACCQNLRLHRSCGQPATSLLQRVCNAARPRRRNRLPRRAPQG